MVIGPKDRPESDRALLDALREGPGSVRTLHRRIGRFSQIALRLALHRLVRAGEVVSREGSNAKIYRLAGKLDAWVAAAQPVRLTSVQLDQLWLVAAAGESGMREGAGAKKNVRLRLLEAGLVAIRNRRVARFVGGREVAKLERRWFVTDSGRQRLKVEQERKAA